MFSKEFVTNLLKKEYLVVASGTAFGYSDKEFVRISYTYSLEVLKKAIDRIERFLDGFNLKTTNYYTFDEKEAIK